MGFVLYISSLPHNHLPLSESICTILSDFELGTSPARSHSALFLFKASSAQHLGSFQMRGLNQKPKHLQSTLNDLQICPSNFRATTKNAKRPISFRYSQALAQGVSSRTKLATPSRPFSRTSGLTKASRIRRAVVLQPAAETLSLEQLGENGCWHGWPLTVK